ncbi:MAG TPA: hypothetical protein VGE12_22080 [Noviherbaspirillum sp.]
MTRTGVTKTSAAKTSRSTRHPVAKATAVAAKKGAPAAKTPAKARAAKPDAKPATKAMVAAPKSEQKIEVKDKIKKVKLVRDSFTMPETEYAVLGDVKKACLKAGVEVKKSELLRVGVALIRQLDVARIQDILAGLPSLKAGRPKKVK